MNQTNIELIFYQSEPGIDEMLQKFWLPEEQLKFTALPMDAIRATISDEGRIPMLIMAENTPVGFFVLHIGEGIKELTNNRKAILIRALSINHSHQGKGYAKQAMLRLPQFVKENFPEYDELFLAVNMKNEGAKALYISSGFIDKGIRKEGKIGEQLILHYYIA